MARRRGFFAEIQHQNKLAEQKRQRERAAAVRAQNQAIRKAELARKQAVRAKAAALRAQEQDRKRAEKEARDLHKQQMIAEAEAVMAGYEAQYEQIDSLLVATLDVDDYVDLESLKRVVEHPHFDPGVNGRALPEPQWLPIPPEPLLNEPQVPTGLKAMFGGRAKFEQRLQQVRQQWEVDHRNWDHYVRVELPRENQRLADEYAARERKRLTDLEEMQRDYQNRCQERQQMVDDHNGQVDDLIRRISEGQPEAVDEYIGIVLANSIYPECYPVGYEFAYDPDLRELSISVNVPRPDELAAVKNVRYVASADEIRETALSKSDQKKRYNNAVHETALRTLHEIFEADRHPWVDSISLSVRTIAIDPATGHDAEYVFVLVAADRSAFMELNLSAVDPQAALEGMRATLSKNPFNLDSVGESGFEVRL
ncbi:hypothetical protein ACFWGD_04370 [Corynebacterium sp. NPDC060344]|uniref:hypothetical protein n=1 Tax=Corynebacterium sp. NPDC060344 TaxID=3347101 RepID=UPI00365BA15C